MNEIQSINLVNAIRKVAKQESTNNMLFGKIVSVTPLKIDIGNNIVLTKKFLYLGQMCRPHKVRIPHTHKYNGETEKATATSGGTLVTPPGTYTPNPNPTKTSGDLSIVSVSTSGATTVTEFTGHSHKIENQETDNVYNEKQDISGEDDDYVVANIYPELKKDDIVLLFAMNNNQMYYVAERIES